MKEISFEVPGQPFGKQRPRVVTRNGFSKAYTPEKTTSYESLVKVCYAEKYGMQKSFNDDEQLYVYIKAFYEIPKSVTKKKREAMIAGLVRPTKKPDWDNVGKIVCDSLNGVAYHDDASVVAATVEKWYAETPCVLIRVRGTE